jgi:hypothetical protein
VTYTVSFERGSSRRSLAQSRARTGHVLSAFNTPGLGARIGEHSLQILASERLAAGELSSQAIEGVAPVSDDGDGARVGGVDQAKA